MSIIDSNRPLKNDTVTYNIDLDTYASINFIYNVVTAPRFPKTRLARVISLKACAW